MYSTCSCFVATRTATADLKVSVNDLTACEGNIQRRWFAARSCKSEVAKFYVLKKEKPGNLYILLMPPGE